MIDYDASKRACVEGPSAGVASSTAPPPEGPDSAPTGAFGVPRVFWPKFVPILIFLVVIGILSFAS